MTPEITESSTVADTPAKNQDDIVTDEMINRLEFHTQLKELIAKPNLYSEKFHIRAFHVGVNLIVGYLVTETEDSFVLAFAHIFSSNGPEMQAVAVSPGPLSRMPKSSFLIMSVPGPRYALSFLECTLARLPDLSGYFTEKRIEKIQAVRAGLIKELQENEGTSLEIEVVRDDGELQGSEEDAPSPPKRTFRAPDYLLKNRTKH